MTLGTFVICVWLFLCSVASWKIAKIIWDKAQKELSDLDGCADMSDLDHRDHI
jgi:hypothetical protein